MVRIQEKIALYLKEYKKNITLERFISQNETKKTQVEITNINGISIPKYINEFWTSKQRQASSIHEISYRACFKPQLPKFFIKLLSKPNDVIYDPFSGRGTTVIEAGLLGRNIISNDINPLSEILTYPRFFIPDIKEVKERLEIIPFDKNNKAEIDLSMFYHPQTESEIISLKRYLIDKKESGTEDFIDKWIRMVATNRLTGHSSGFFSLYTLPPNQAVSPERQRKINKQRNQVPPYRNVKELIVKKSKSLLRNISNKQKENLEKAGKSGIFLTKDARETKEIESETVQLVVTSPPFLDVVQYSKDNWLRCWFNDIDTKEIEKKITVTRNVDQWSNVMLDVFRELFRVVKSGGWVAFEVGEVRKGTIKLEEYIIPIGLKVGFECEGVIINLQKFTKTANIWGIKNNKLGTNTNRIVLFIKP